MQRASELGMGSKMESKRPRVRDALARSWFLHIDKVLAYLLSKYLLKTDKKNRTSSGKVQTFRLEFLVLSTGPRKEHTNCGTKIIGADRFGALGDLFFKATRDVSDIVELFMSYYLKDYGATQDASWIRHYTHLS